MSHSNDTATGQVRLAVVMDVLSVAVFVIVGRLSHHETLTPGGLLRTIVPFFVGLVVGWTAVVVLRMSAARWRGGVVVWAATLVVGMVIRHFTHQGVAVSFVIVAAIFLALFLIGWRLVAKLVKRHS